MDIFNSLIAPTSSFHRPSLASTFHALDSQVNNCKQIMWMNTWFLLPFASTRRLFQQLRIFYMLAVKMGTNMVLRNGDHLLKWRAREGEKSKTRGQNWGPHSTMVAIVKIPQNQWHFFFKTHYINTLKKLDLITDLA